MTRYKIPKNCPNCGSTKLHTERGIQIVNSYENGKRIKFVQGSDGNFRIFCDADKCFVEIARNDKNTGWIIYTDNPMKSKSSETAK